MSAFEQVMGIIHGTPDGAHATGELLAAKFDDVYATLVQTLSVESPIADEIITRFNACRPSVQRKLLACPELWDAIYPIKLGYAPDASAYAELLRHLLTITIKLLIAGGNCNDEDTRHILDRCGDCFVSPLGDVLVSHVRSNYWDRTAVPKIGLTIALDFDSPLASQFDSSSVVFGLPLLHWSDGEKFVVQERLQRAVALIDEASSALGLLIRNFVRRIFVRKSLALSADGRVLGSPLLTSEHLPRYPGTIGIGNPHLKVANVVFLMETILHESVHNMMSCFETAYGEFMPDDKSYRPISPWSGDPIPNHSLAHAIFVYYACYHLLNRCLERDVFVHKCERDFAEVRIGDFAAGFMIQRKLTKLFLTTTPLKPDLYDAIDQMQRTVKASASRATGVLAV